MICLPSTDKLQIKLGAGHTTSALQYSVTYAKKSTGAVASGRGSSDGTNDVDVVPAPTSGDFHLVKQLTVYNADTVAQTVTVKIDVSGTDYVLWKGSVAVGATLFYSPESGFTCTTTFNSLLVNGGTSLGGAAANPYIVLRKLSGTTPAAEGGETTISHSISTSKLLSLTALVFFQTDIGVPPFYTHVAGYQYEIYCSSTSVHCELSDTNSENILSKPVVFTLVYEV